MKKSTVKMVNVRCEYCFTGFKKSARAKYGTCPNCGVRDTANNGDPKKIAAYRRRITREFNNMASEEIKNILVETEKVMKRIIKQKHVSTLMYSFKVEFITKKHKGLLAAVKKILEGKGQIEL